MSEEDTTRLDEDLLGRLLVICGEDLVAGDGLRSPDDYARLFPGHAEGVRRCIRILDVMRNQEGESAVMKDPPNETP